MDDSCIHHTVPFSENVDYLSSNYISDYHLYVCWKQNNTISIKAHKEDISLTIPLTISRRLENTSWRRWVKQQKLLTEILPAAINWNKYQDVTWLYGPKYTSPCPYDQQSTQSSQCMNGESTNTQNRNDQNKRKSIKNNQDSSDSNIDTYMHDCEGNNDSANISQKHNQNENNTCLELTQSNLRKWNDAPDVDSDDSASIRLASSMSFGSDSIPSDGYSDDEDEMDGYSHIKPVLKQRSNPFVRNSKSKKLVKFSYVINSREYSNGLSFDYYFLDTLCL